MHVKLGWVNNKCRILVGKPLGEWLLGRPRRWDNIKKYPREICFEVGK